MWTAARQVAIAILVAAIVAAVVAMIYLATRDDPRPAERAESADREALAAPRALDSEVSDAGGIRLVGGGAVVAFGLPAVWIAGFVLTVVTANRRKALGPSDATT